MTDVSKHPDRWEEVALDYLEGRLTPEEAARLEKHLATCSACRKDLDEQRHVALLLGSVTEAPSPAGLEAEVLEQVGAAEPTGRAKTVGAAETVGRTERWTDRIVKRGRLRSAVWLPTAAALLLLAVIFADASDLFLPGDDAEVALDGEAVQTRSDGAADTTTAGDETDMERAGVDAGAADSEIGADTTASDLDEATADDGSEPSREEATAQDYEGADEEPSGELFISVRSDDGEQARREISSFLGVEALQPARWLDGPTFVVEVDERFLENLLSGLRGSLSDAALIANPREAESGYELLLSSYEDPETVVPAENQGSRGFKALSEEAETEETDPGRDSREEPSPDGRKIVVLISVELR